jgi:putative transposase
LANSKWSWTFSKKGLASSLEQRRLWIDPQHADLSVQRQCELLGLPRSTYYYQPRPESAENLRLLRRLDELYLECPFFGSRRMAVMLAMNRKRIQRLMRIMGIEALYPKPNLSRPAPGHEVYPYLLRGISIERPNQVWSTDITYIPMRAGFLYLVAIMDWFSRFVLSWELSNTMETGFCLAALEAAFRFGQPEIWNSDQGSQFTAADFLAPLKERGIRISMDGRGRALDNVFIERLWRSLKYELIYPGDFASGAELMPALDRYFHFYNHRRPHQALGYRTPADLYPRRSTRKRAWL